MQTLYHTIVVHLFRPMLKVDLIHSDLHPRDICVEAANRVSEIVRTYRQLYDFRVAHLVIPHILLSVSIVHLLYSKENRTSHQNLVEGLQGLEDLHECHYFGARSFRIIYTLAKTWNLAWPEELRNSKLVPKSNPNRPRGTISPPADPWLVAPNTATTADSRVSSNTSYPPIGNPNRSARKLTACDSSSDISTWQCPGFSASPAVANCWPHPNATFQCQLANINLPILTVHVGSIRRYLRSSHFSQHRHGGITLLESYPRHAWAHPTAQQLSTDESHGPRHRTPTV
jgi:hypothetical protein